MMITLRDLYNVLGAVVPLYCTMLLAYASVKRWKVFTPEQCAGINRFVAVFAVPFLSFDFISRVDPFRMNPRFVAADAASKVLVSCFLFAWTKFSRRGGGGGSILDWSITLFSLSALPNTLVMGIPLLKSMYGEDSEGLMIQVVVLQTLIWYTLLLFLFEYREARRAVLEEEPQGVSLRSFCSTLVIEKNLDAFPCSFPFNLLRFLLVSSPCSNHAVRLLLLSISPIYIPRPSRSRACDNRSVEFQRPKGSEVEVVHVIVANLSSSETESNQRKKQISSKVVPGSGQLGMEEEEYAWPCLCCNPQRPGERSLQVLKGEGTKKQELEEEEEDEREGKEGEEDESVAAMDAIPTISSGMITLILRMVGSKLIRNPNSYASLLGLSWAMVASRWNIKKPLILENSVTILSNAGLGMAMFSLGLFMALQPRIMACGKKMAAYGMVMRFLVGPAVMAVASLGVGIRDTTLKVSIVQAALPLGLVPFVFAREYNLHPEVLSTAVIFGMIVSLPVTILYYVFLGL